MDRKLKRMQEEKEEEVNAGLKDYKMPVRSQKVLNSRRLKEVQRQKTQKKLGGFWPT